MLNVPRLPQNPLRRAAVQELTSKLPAHVRDEWFEGEVCQGRIPYRGYNPGADLCHWLLWKLGCTDSRVLCRSIPERNMEWDKYGVDRLYEGAQKMAAWKAFQLDHTPMPGDIIHLGSPSQGDPHAVCVFLWSYAREWVVADANQVDAFGDPCALIIVAPFAGYHLSFGGQKKQVNGWVDITAVGIEVTD